jgi:hypothetical protein
MPFGPDEIVRLLQRDVVRTAGESYRELVLEVAVNARSLDNGDDDERVVGDVQQYFHDTFCRHKLARMPTTRGSPALV